MDTTLTPVHDKHRSADPTPAQGTGVPVAAGLCPSAKPGTAPRPTL